MEIPYFLASFSWITHGALREVDSLTNDFRVLLLKGSFLRMRSSEAIIEVLVISLFLSNQPTS